MLQATEQGLDSAAATQLLVETLQYNGLPLVGQAAADVQDDEGRGARQQQPCSMEDRTSGGRHLSGRH